MNQSVDRRVSHRKQEEEIFCNLDICKSTWKRALNFMTKYAMKNREQSCDMFEDKSEGIRVLKRPKSRFILETSVQVVS